MIPAFTHCQDCGNAPEPIRSLWADMFVGWWCRACKVMLS